jgi:hypothetical protein
MGVSVFPSAFRARIEGAVVRFPGTGEGVALLVLVSMVKVDMGAASSGEAGAPPVQARCAGVTVGTSTAVQASKLQVRGMRARVNWKWS